MYLGFKKLKIYFNYFESYFFLGGRRGYFGLSLAPMPLVVAGDPKEMLSQSIEGDHKYLWSKRFVPLRKLWIRLTLM